MAGLVPAIHVFFGSKEHVDARDKHGHDDSLESSSIGNATHFAGPDSRAACPTIFRLASTA